MGAIASETTGLTIVHSTVYSGADKKKHQSSASLAFMWGIHRWPVNFPHKWPVTRKMFPFDDVIMPHTLLGWDNLSVLELRLIYVCKSGPRGPVSIYLSPWYDLFYCQMPCVYWISPIIWSCMMLRRNFTCKYLQIRCTVYFHCTHDGIVRKQDVVYFSTFSILCHIRVFRRL